MHQATVAQTQSFRCQLKEGGLEPVEFVHIGKLLNFSATCSDASAGQMEY